MHKLLKAMIKKITLPTKMDNQQMEWFASSCVIQVTKTVQVLLPKSALLVCKGLDSTSIEDKNVQLR